MTETPYWSLYKGAQVELSKIDNPFANRITRGNIDILFSRGKLLGQYFFDDRMSVDMLVFFPDKLIKACEP